MSQTTSTTTTTPVTKKKKKKNNYYFTEQTEEAIIEYNNSESHAKRNRLYNEEIYPAFRLIAENIFQRYFKSNYFKVPQSEIINDVISFLTEKMPKYKAKKGKGKAFGYFSVIAKNYLILENNKKYKTKKKKLFIEEVESFELEDEDYSIIELSSDTRDLLEELREYWDIHGDEYFTRERDLQICYAIVEMLEQIDKIDNFNKKALYFFIREMTGEKTLYITKVLNVMRDEYMKQKRRIMAELAETTEIF